MFDDFIFRGEKNMKKHCSTISVKAFPLPAFLPPDPGFLDDFCAMNRALANFFGDLFKS